MDCFVWHIGYVGSGIDGTYSAGISPTQELVDAFNTLDGEPVLDLSKPYLDDKHLLPNYNPNSQYDPNNPFANRDPRMDETLLHNGSTFYYQGEKRTIETFEGAPTQLILRLRSTTLRARATTTANSCSPVPARGRRMP